jgi:L-lactate dehydrogenase complex protein LldG
MGSKSEILSRIRKYAPSDVALPADVASGIRFVDRQAHFAEVLKSVGGQIIEVAGQDALRSAIANLPCMADAKQVVCTIASVDVGNVSLANVADPHELAGVDVAIVAGEFGVAENAAVWVSGLSLRHRSVLFLAQHLVLVVPRGAMYDNLHEAYKQLGFDNAGYGVFISGPSKTADIEQSLVIGAHGPRSLTVILHS